MPIPTTTATPAPPTSIANRRPAVIAAAVAAAVATWAVAVPLFGIKVLIPESPGSAPTEPLGAASVIGAATVAALVGWAALAILERLTRRARTIWTVGALVVLVATMPWSPDFTGAARAVLVVLHLVVAGVLIPGMRRPPGMRTGPPA
jgi:hypothetical protein